MTQTSAKPGIYRANDKCDCGLPLVSPDKPWWLPTASLEPGYDVNAVVRYGEDPVDRCAVRVPFGWVLRGRNVPPCDEPEVIPWVRVGTCPARMSHPVVAVESLTAAHR